jgi:hypothetical protein
MAHQSNQSVGRRLLNLQTLEAREVPATTIALAGSVYSIVNAATEAVSVTLGRTGANYTLQITGGTFTIPGVADPNITYTGIVGSTATGANLAAGANTLAFDLGGGNDTLVAGTGDLSELTPAAGTTLSISVTGGGGADLLRLNDSASTDPAEFTVAGDSFARTTGSGATARTVSISLTEAIESAAVAAGTGADRVVLATGAGVALPTTLSVDGGTGTDTLTLRDTDTNGHTYEVTGTALDRDGRAFPVGGRAFEAGEIEGGTGGDTITVVNLPTVSGGSAPVTLSGGGGNDPITVENAGANAQLTINGDAGNDTVTVEQAAASAVLSIFGGDNNDTFRIGNSGNPIGLIDASITVDGGPAAGTDQLTVDDQSASSDHTYEVKAIGADFMVGHEGSGEYRYTGIDDLTLRTSDTGGAADTIRVTATAAKLTVDGGDGANRFEIGSAAGTLDGLGADISLQGGSGTDRLFVADGSDTDANKYTAAAASVSREAGAVLRKIEFNSGLFASVSLAVGTPAVATEFNTVTVTGTASNSPLTVTGGAGIDKIEVRATAGSGPVTVAAGAGDDEVTVGGGTLSTLAGSVTVDGEGGAANTLTVNDSTFGSAREFTVHGDLIEADGGAADISYDGFETLTVNAGTAGDSLEVLGHDLPAGSVNVFNGGGGDDAFTVAPALTGSTVAIAVNGGAPTGTNGDALFVKLDNIPNPLTVFTPEVPAGTTTVAGFLGIAYTSIEETGLDTDQFNLPGDGTDQTLRVFDITSGSAKVKLGNFATLKVKDNTQVGWTAGGGVDRVVYEDDGQTTGRTYTVNPTGVLRSASTLANFTFADVQVIEIQAGSGADQFVVTDLAAGVTLVAAAGDGNDTVTGGSVAGSVDLDLGDDNDSVTLGIVAGGVTVGGGLGNDTVTVTAATGSVSLNGGAGTDSLSIGTASGGLTVDAGDGNDTVSAGSVAGTVELLGGIGNDSLAIGKAAGALEVDGGLGNDTVTAGTGGLDDFTASADLKGGADSDRVVIVDTDTTGNTYEVTATTVARTTVGSVRTFTYAADFEAVELRVAGGANTIDIPATAAGAPVAVIGGTGADQVVVGDGTLDAIASAVSVDGGGGADSLVVNDSTKATAQSYSVSNTSVTRAAIPSVPQAAVTVNYSDIDGVVLRAGTLGDTVTVTTSAAGTDVTILGGDGDDTVTVGTGNLDDVDGPIQVDGEAGADALIVADGGVNQARDYEISTTQVLRTGAAVGTATVGFTNVAALTVNAGQQADSIEVTATSIDTPVVVNAGTGNDTVSVGGGTLDDLIGPLTLVSGTDGADKLIVDDSAATAGGTYTVNATHAGTAAHSFAYFDAGFREVGLRGGLGDDTIDVPAAAVPVTVIGGGGNDDITIGTGSLDQVLASVDVTGDSNDRLTVNDQADGDGAAYTIEAAQVTRTGAGAITFNTLGALVLNTSTGNDTVGVNDTTVPTTVSAGTGADSITIEETSSSVTVNGEAGPDTVTAGAGDLGLLAGPVSVTGGADADADKLAVNDSNSAAGRSYTIGLTQVTSGTVAVNYSAIQIVELTAGGSGDQVTVAATAADTTVSVNAGAGDDTVRVGGGDVDTLAGPLVLNAGVGAADRLIVDDSAEAVQNRTYTVTAGTVTAAGYSVNYGLAAFERLEVLGGASNDTATVEATAAGIPVTVSGGLGTDTVYVGSGNLDSLLADVTASGGDGTGDRLEIRDQASAAANSYTLTDAALVRGTRQINYGTFDQVSVTAGTGADTVLVSSTPDDVPVTVAGGDGNDTVTIRPLNDIRASLSIVGGALPADNDVLVADDSAAGAGHTYTVEADRVTRAAGAVAIDFAAIDRVELRSGSQGDTVTVPSIAAGMTAALFTAGGNDEINVGNGSLDAILGAFALDADTGSDRLTVDDQADSDNNNYVLTSQSVTRNTNAPAVSYGTAEIEALELLAGAGDDTIAITSTAVGVPVTVNAGSGNDALTVGGGSLDGLLANVTLVGDTGTDGLIVDDSLDASDNAYRATKTNLTRTVVAPPDTKVIDHNSFDTFALRAGLGSNTIDVLEMDKDVTIVGGAGNDTVTFGNDGTGGFPEGLTGFSADIDIAISAGGGEDNRLTFNDAPTGANQKYTITPFAIIPTPLAAPSGSSGPVFPYLGGFQQVLLQAGQGSDLIESDSAKGVNLSVDGGPGTNLFRIDYLGGSVFGGAGIDTFFGRKRETASLQDGASRFVIDGPNTGTVADRLGGRFEGIENLVGGGLNDSFTFATGGSLAGSIKGEGGTDELFGDNTARTYRLTGPGKGSVLGLTPNFEGIESIFGGIQDDTLVIPNALPNDGLSVFDGGRGKDLADFTEWTTAKTVSVTGVGTSGFHLTDGPVLPAELDRHKFKNLDVVLGSPGNADALVQTTNIPTGWVYEGGSGLSYMTEKPLPAVGGVAPDERLEFVGFERLNGGMGPDTFRVDLATIAAGGPDLLVNGGISPRESDRMDRLDILGTTAADTFRMLPRTQTFPTGTVGTTNANSVAGVQLTGKPRILYDAIKDLSVEGGVGNDTFIVEPPAKPAGATKANPLFGAHVRNLFLQGGAGDDRFELVPDAYNTAIGTTKFDAKVDYHVFGGTMGALVANGPWKPYYASTAAGNDTMILYQLPVRVKANFPLHGQFGPPTNQFELTKPQYRRGAVNFYDFFTVVASTKKKAIDVVIPPP